MTLYSDRDHEVIYRILELLPTIEEVLEHMMTQVDELRLEGAELLFRDATQAIGTIASNLVLLTTDQDEVDILQYTGNMREAISVVVDGFEASNLSLIHTALANHLLPAFRMWKQQVEQILQPAIIS